LYGDYIVTTHALLLLLMLLVVMFELLLRVLALFLCVKIVPLPFRDESNALPSDAAAASAPTVLRVPLSAPPASPSPAVVNEVWAVVEVRAMKLVGPVVVIGLVVVAVVKVRVLLVQMRRPASPTSAARVWCKAPASALASPLSVRAAPAVPRLAAPTTEMLVLVVVVLHPAGGLIRIIRDMGRGRLGQGLVGVRKVACMTLHAGTFHPESASYLVSPFCLFSPHHIALTCRVLAIYCCLALPCIVAVALHCLTLASVDRLILLTSLYLCPRLHLISSD
jgi:hypothetical protein